MRGRSSDFELVPQPKKFEIGLRNIAGQGEHNPAPGFFGREVLGPGSFVRATDTAPDVGLPCSACYGQEEPLSARLIGGRTIDELIVAVADDCLIVDGREVLGPGLRCDLACLLDTGDSGSQVVVGG